MKPKKVKFEFIRLILYAISIIIVIVAVATDYQGGCYWRENYGILCPTCGLTRATKSFVRLNFKEAFEYNAFYTCIILPLVLFLVINDVFIIVKRAITRKEEYSCIEIIIGGAKNKHKEEINNKKYIIGIIIILILFALYGISRNFIKM